MPTGFVKWFNETKGYGFIQPDDGGEDAFVHVTALERSGMQTLRENQRVAYEMEEDKRRGKTSAVNLRDAGEVDQAVSPPPSAADDTSEQQ